MAKSEQKTLAPNTVEATEKHLETTPVNSSEVGYAKELEPGHVLVVELDDDGNETEITFTTREIEFDKYYSKNPKFKIQKKAK